MHPARAARVDAVRPAASAADHAASLEASRSQLDSRLLQSLDSEASHLLPFARRCVIPAQQVEQPVYREQRELSRRGVAILDGLALGRGPRDGDVSEVAG